MKGQVLSYFKLCYLEKNSALSCVIPGGEIRTCVSVTPKVLHPFSNNCLLKSPISLILLSHNRFIRLAGGLTWIVFEIYLEKAS